jgi:hypothetical protein
MAAGSEDLNETLTFTAAKTEISGALAKGCSAEDRAAGAAETP